MPSTVSGTPLPSGPIPAQVIVAGRVNLDAEFSRVKVTRRVPYDWKGTRLKLTVIAEPDDESADE